MCLVACCASASAAPARKARSPKAASSPSTAQILAPSADAVPDALPPAQEVYRCGSSYSARACVGAPNTPLDVSDARSDAQRRQSAELTVRDKRLAALYEAGRREREAVASAPAQRGRKSATAVCTDTAMMTCVPRKPRSRKLLASGASGPAMAGK